MLEILARGNRQEKEIEDVKIRKGEVKLSLFVGNMILYIVDHKTPLKTIRTHKQIQQDFRVPRQYTSIYHIFIL